MLQGVRTLETPGVDEKSQVQICKHNHLLTFDGIVYTRPVDSPPTLDPLTWSPMELPNGVVVIDANSDGHLLVGYRDGGVWFYEKVEDDDTEKNEDTTRAGRLVQMGSCGVRNLKMFGTKFFGILRDDGDFFWYSNSIKKWRKAGNFPGALGFDYSFDLEIVIITDSQRGFSVVYLPSLNDNTYESWSAEVIQKVEDAFLKTNKRHPNTLQPSFHPDGKIIVLPSVGGPVFYEFDEN
eukprot:Trichotokara_eunicae@DN3050_c0_g1_i2.p1